MTAEEIMKAILFFVTVAGAGWGIWWRIDARVEKVRKETQDHIDSTRREAETVARDLAAYRTHVAETYTTKSGMREIRDEILGAVSGIRDDVRHLGSRIDAMHDSASKPRRRLTNE